MRGNIHSRMQKMKNQKMICKTNIKRRKKTDIYAAVNSNNKNTWTDPFEK